MIVNCYTFIRPSGVFLSISLAYRTGKKEHFNKIKKETMEKKGFTQ